MAKEDYKDHVKNVSNVSKHKRMANTSKHEILYRYHYAVLCARGARSPREGGRARGGSRPARPTDG